METESVSVTTSQMVDKVSNVTYTTVTTTVTTTIATSTVTRLTETSKTESQMVTSAQFHQAANGESTSIFKEQARHESVTGPRVIMTPSRDDSKSTRPGVISLGALASAVPHREDVIPPETDATTTPIFNVPVRDEDEPTDLGVSFKQFLDCVLSENDAELAAVTKVARAVAVDKRFLAGLELYNTRWEDYADETVIELSLLDIFNDVRFAGPVCGLNIPYPYHIRFALNPERGGPRCFGTLREDCDAGRIHWVDTLIAVDVVSHKRRRSPTPEWYQDWERGTGSSDGAGDARPVHSPKNAPRAPLPPDISELTRIASKVVCYTGHRRHILGVLVDGPEMFLLYYDRAGSIRSSRVHMINDPVSAITAILLLHLSTSKRLGFDPIITPPSHLQLPTRVEGCHFDVEGYTFTLDRFLHRSQSLYGRGTVVYSARPALPPQEPRQRRGLLPDVVIVKTSWQITTRELEDGLYKRAAACHVEGVTKLYCSHRGGMLSDGIRTRLVSPGAYTDRELRVQVLGPVCTPLWAVADVDTFKTAFISLVQAHHDLNEKAGILHRDISIMNLMVDASNPSIGVLIDFDLAAIVRDDDGNPVPLKPMLAGTRPFLALDLLQDAPIAQPYYRHDLESFLYVLAWILAHFDKGKSVQDYGLISFHEGDWRRIRTAKQGFLKSGSEFESVGDLVLKHTWVHELGQLFSKGYNARGHIHFDESTLDGHVTFEKFMYILKNPRPWP